MTTFTIDSTNHSTASSSAEEASHAGECLRHFDRHEEPPEVKITPVPTLAFHPVTSLFPLLEGEEFDALVKDIAEHGLCEAIWTYQGKIIDGRNRYRGCLKAGVEPGFRKWDGNGSLTAFVWSLNGVRRHLQPGQKAAIAVEMLPQLEAEAAARRAAVIAKQDRDEAGRVKPLPQKIGEAEKGSHDCEATKRAAQITGTNRQYVADAKKLKAEAPELFEQLKAGQVTIKEAKEEIRKTQKAALVERIKQEPVAPPKGPFRVIVIDPPWRYESRREDITHRGRCPYPDMSLDEIKSLPVAELAHKDCVLWLWSTNAFLEEAFACVRAWDFEPTSMLTWFKDRMGLGDWLRGQTEHCIMAVRGKPSVTLTNQTTALEAPLREHSRKPAEFFALVDSLCPGSKLEMFARERRDGWQSCGAELKEMPALFATSETARDAMMHPEFRRGAR